MTRIDRYLLTLFVRTVLLSFCSLAGVFIVFHAFAGMDELVKQVRSGTSWTLVLARFFGPQMLLLFDWTGAIVALMALLFTVGWLRRSGELTAMLAAGVSHGRILRPLVIAVVVLVSLQLFNREWVLPQTRESLTMKARDLDQDPEQLVRPKYDRSIGILLAGKSLRSRHREIIEPNFTIHGDYPGFGDRLQAHLGRWQDANGNHPDGYLLSGVVRPLGIDELRSTIVDRRPILMTSYDQAWMQPGECFVATSVDTDLLQTNPAATKLASVRELAERVRNPAVHSSASVRVLLHERILRPPLDFALVMLTLPLVVNRRGRGLFVLIGAAVGLVLFFFAVKTVANTMGSSGYVLTPAMAAWLPLIVIGPFAYVRLRELQSV